MFVIWALVKPGVDGDVVGGATTGTVATVETAGLPVIVDGPFGKLPPTTVAVVIPLLPLALVVTAVAGVYQG